jgi:hypothetical protein
MIFSVRTKKVDMALPARTSALDLHENISQTTTAVPVAADSVFAQTHRLDFTQPCGTSSMSLATQDAASHDIPLITDEQKNIPTHGMTFYKAAPVAATKKIPLDRPAQPRTHELRMVTSDMVSFKTVHVDDMPQTRDMINLKYLDYPRISQYITRLADEHGQSYSGIKLIGIYEPVPLHRAYNLKLDTFSGRLSFHMRPEDSKIPKRFARVAYARVRMTGDIIQSVYPVT